MSKLAKLWRVGQTHRIYARSGNKRRLSGQYDSQQDNKLLAQLDPQNVWSDNPLRSVGSRFPKMYKMLEIALSTTKLCPPVHNTPRNWQRRCATSGTTGEASILGDPEVTSGTATYCDRPVQRFTYSDYTPLAQLVCRASDHLVMTNLFLAEPKEAGQSYGVVIERYDTMHLIHCNCFM